MVISVASNFFNFLFVLIPEVFDQISFCLCIKVRVSTTVFSFCSWFRHFVSRRTGWVWQLAADPCRLPAQAAAADSPVLAAKCMTMIKLRTYADSDIKAPKGGFFGVQRHVYLYEDVHLLWKMRIFIQKNLLKDVHLLLKMRIFFRRWTSSYR